MKGNKNGKLNSEPEDLESDNHSYEEIKTKGKSKKEPFRRENSGNNIKPEFAKKVPNT